MLGVVLQNLRNAFVGSIHVPPELALAELPAVFRRILTEIGELRAREDQLRDLVNTPVFGCPVGLSHGRAFVS